MWKTILEDLQASGLSQSQIATAVGASQPTIHALLREKQRTVMFSLGLGLWKLHRQHCPDRPDVIQSAFRFYGTARQAPPRGGQHEREADVERT
jgi:hypothetical protein